MINFSLAREIYGGQSWMVDPISFSSLYNILKDFRQGVKITTEGEDKLNSSFLFEVGSTATIDSQRRRRRDKDDDDSKSQLISVVNIDGPITKNGGASSFGMKDVASQMDSYTDDPRVIGQILVTDSGGGATNAIVFMADAIAASQRAGKPVVQFIEKGSLSASAAYFIGSYTDSIISESESNIVGSLGTMIEFEGIPRGVQKDPNSNIVNVRVYATASINKNGAFEQALEGNVDPIITEMLDPINEEALASVRANRPNISEGQLEGSVFRSGDVVGTLVDSIGNFDSAVDKVLELSRSGEIKNFQSANEPNNNLLTKNNKMNLSELKSDHPTVYAQAVAVGVSAEKDRVGSWMAHSENDLETVKAGIKSGEAISGTQTQELLVKGYSKKTVESIKKDSKTDVVTEDPKGAAVEQMEVDNFYAEVDAKLGISKTK